MCHSILSHTLFCTLPRFGPFSCMRVFTLALWSYYCLVYRIAENFQGRKLSQILQFCDYSRKFSLQNLGAWCPLAQQKRGIHKSFLYAKIRVFFTNSQKFSPSKVSRYTILMQIHSDHLTTSQSLLLSYMCREVVNRRSECFANVTHPALLLLGWSREGEGGGRGRGREEREGRVRLGKDGRDR